MLLSTCISFLLAKSVRRKFSYVLLLIPIILFTSFFSAHYVDRFRYWLGPLPLSFPFYTDPFAESTTTFFPFATHHGLCFLGWRISSFTLPLQLETLAFLTSFFLLINLLGAMLGYWINKRLPEESLKREMFDFFFKFGIWSSFLFFVGTTWIFAVLFWTFAVIATAVYGIYKWFRRRKE